MCLYEINKKKKFLYLDNISVAKMIRQMKYMVHTSLYLNISKYQVNKLDLTLPYSHTFICPVYTSLLKSVGKIFHGSLASDSKAFLCNEGRRCCFTVHTRKFM